MTLGKMISRKSVCLTLLFLINLLNYMDRLTVSGVATILAKKSQSGLDIDLDDKQVGLLQTIFVLSFMFLSPVFGYFGDRYNRRIIIIFGVLFWCSATLLCSFAQTYWQLMLFRGLVGVGEASYATIAPTIIADMYVENKRMAALVLFYIGIPAGGAIGLSFGGFVGNLLGWRWAFRFTPVVGLLLSIVGFFFILDPVRGGNEPGGKSHHGSNKAGVKAVVNDFKYCMSVPSFVLSTIGFTSVTFATGAFSLWGPKYISIAAEIPIDTATTNLGIITFITGILGTLLGAYLSKIWTPCFPAADPLVCALGTGVSSPLLLLSIFLFGTTYIYVAWVAMFFVLLGFCLNWAVVAAILLYVIEAKRRSIAEAVQILCSHILGDALSPYLTGFISDELKKHGHTEETALAYALVTCAITGFIGTVAFALNACYYVKDKDAACSSDEDQQPLLDDDDDENILEQEQNEEREQSQEDSEMLR